MEYMASCSLDDHVTNGNWEGVRSLLQDSDSLNVAPLVNSSTMKKLWKLPDVPKDVLDIFFARLKDHSSLYAFVVERLFGGGDDDDDDDDNNNNKRKHRSCKLVWERLAQQASYDALDAFVTALGSRVHHDSNNDGTNTTTPLHDFCRGAIVGVWKDVLWSGERATKAKQLRADLVQVQSMDDLVHNDDKYQDLHMIFKKTDLLVRAAYAKEVEACEKAGRGPFRIVHAIAGLGCPTITLWFAMRLFPEEIRARDYLGRLPLHWAASRHPKRMVYPTRLEGELGEANERAMTLLLDRYPEGARCADSEGKLPLFVALEIFPRLTYHGHVRDVQQFSIEPLLRIAPEALQTRVPTSGLFPYQHAAAHGAPVNIIYSLLAQCPGAMQNRNLSKAERDYERLLAENVRLKRRLVEMEEELQAENRKLKEENETLKEERRKWTEEMSQRDDDSTGDAQKRARTSLMS